jgi:ribonuclease-3
MPIAQLTQLEKALAYTFKQQGLLNQALTHRSAKGQHNERLEYLGDSILGFVIADYLYHQFPKHKEGDLSRVRSSLVKGDTLSIIGRELQLGDYLQLGPGELKSGGHNRDSILADAVESIIGAVYLDAGLDESKALIMRLFAERLKNMNPNLLLKDNKTRLQEHLQARGLPLPDYQVKDILGADHKQEFIVSCQVAGIAEEIVCKASSRKKAEHACAKIALEQLGV